MIVMYWQVHGKFEYETIVISKDKWPMVIFEQLEDEDNFSCNECLWIIPGTFDQLYNDAPVKDNGWMIDYNIVPIVD